MAVTAPASFLRRSIEKSLRELPALPDAVMKVLDETNRAEPCSNRVEAHVLSDQALTSKLLRVVNSAYYGLSGQVTSVSQAIVILGMQQVRNLVLSVGCLSLFEASSARQQEALRSFWLHSFSTAAATQVIAAHKGADIRAKEGMFVGGLLHDIGRLFLFANFTMAFEQALLKAEKEGISLEECELAILGLGHAEIGREMALVWRLPESIVTMIGNHEGPFDGTEHSSLYCVHVADAVTKHLYFGEGVNREINIDPYAATWLGLDEKTMQWLASEVVDKIEEANEIYNLMAA